MSTPTIVRTWDTAEDALSKVLPGYEKRDQQTALGREIERAIADGENLAAEAGTGTGKSFAALLPSIIHALQTGKSVVVATGTKALQGQYSLEDIPFLVEKLAEFWGTPVNWVELKGISNYLCKAKVDAGVDVDYVTDLMDELAANPNHSGDLDRFQLKISPKDRPKLGTSSDECPGASQCPFGSECYGQRAKAKAREAHLVITNHKLLAIDTMIASPIEPGGKPVSVMFGDYDVVIVDEAQAFRDYMTDTLGAEISEGTFTHLATQIDKLLGGQGMRKLLGAVTRLFRELGDLVPPRSSDAIRLTETSLLPMRPLMDEIADELTHAFGQLAGIPCEDDRRLKSKVQRLMQRINSTLAKLSTLAPWDEDDEADVEGEKVQREDLIGEVVRWVSRDGDKVTAGYTPLSVARFLNEKLWKHRTGILLSATLANGKDFSYVPGILGMTGCRTFDAGTPFNYPEQARLWVPEGLDPRKGENEWFSAGHMVTYDLVMAAGGRALLLFTSRKALNQRWDALAGAFEDADIPCRRQEQGTSADELIRWKNDNPEGVVFGLKSLMEGVSVKRPESLRLVILDRMPFTPPSRVVFKARKEAMDAAVARREGLSLDKASFFEGPRGNGSFFGMSVPEMMLVIKQGFGRLIRSKRHEGLMVVLDSRMSPKSGTGYGKRVFRNLPKATPLDSKAEAVRYLKGFNAA